MAWFRFILVLVLTLVLIWRLDTPAKAGDKNLPALGAFFNPFSGFWRNAEPLDLTKGQTATLAVPGLQGKVEVTYDDLMVPHIFAENLEDAARVQGYVTAKDRLWQMDITVRKASGRLSEVLGDRTMNVDRLARRRGMVFAAENAVIGWKRNPESLKWLEAYTEGVNAYIAGLSPADYPLEFKLLSYTPEPWSLLKTALVIEAMAENLATYDNDLGATNALATFGQETFDSLYPEWFNRQQPIVPDTGQWKNAQPYQPAVTPTNALLSGNLDAEDDGGLWAATATEGPDGYLKGSNNWSVSGIKTASGHPMLANDPHLTLTLPSIWYMVQVNTTGYSCYGVSLAGVPGIIIGYNDDIAWGVTNVSHDVSDWYKMHWTDASHTKYMVDGEAREVQRRIEVIQIKGHEPLIDTVSYTVFGPVVYSFDPKHPLHDCAYKWVSHDTPRENMLADYLKLNAGKSYDDYRSAISSFDCPAQNFVFASKSGDIGITVQGRLPLRGKEQGRFVLEGDRWQNAWQDYIPEALVPALKNPSRGFAFSANQHSTSPTYPYYYLGNFDSSRGRRIFHRLTELQHATIDSMKALQLDNYSQRSADARAALLKLLDTSKLDAEGKEMVTEITGWNGYYNADLLAPTLFDMWWDSCYTQIWDEMEALRKADKYVPNPDPMRTVELLESDTQNRFFDHPKTPGQETAADIVLESFRAMQGYFQKNPAQKTTWGKAKGFQIKHIAQLDAFSRLDVVVGGTKTAPNAIGKNHGPSWRMIVDLGETVKGYGVYPGGQSGNPGSPYYDNMVDKWAKGEYYELLNMHAPDEQPDRTLKRITFTSK